VNRLPPRQPKRDGHGFARTDDGCEDPWGRYIRALCAAPAADRRRPPVLAAAAALAPGIDWDAYPWQADRRGEVKESTGAKGRAPFVPAAWRRALTGRRPCPDMGELLAADRQGIRRWRGFPPANRRLSVHGIADSVA